MSLNFNCAKLAIYALGRFSVDTAYKWVSGNK